MGRSRAKRPARPAAAASTDEKRAARTPKRKVPERTRADRSSPSRAREAQSDAAGGAGRPRADPARAARSAPVPTRAGRGARRGARRVEPERGRTNAGAPEAAASEARAASGAARGRPRSTSTATRDEIRALRELARLHRVELAPPGARSERETSVAPERLVAVLRALDVPIESPAGARALLLAHRDAIASRMIEPAAALAADAPSNVLLRFPDARVPRILVRIELEDGRELELRTRLSSPVVRRRSEDDGAGGVLRRLALPALPAGYHTLACESAGARFETRLLVAPAQAHVPDGAAARAFGVFAPLYALRSADDFGIGGYGDLARIAAWSAAHGGSLVGTLPLLATFLDEPFDPSPYAPISRRFWNEVYLDLEGLPELELSSAARDLLASPAWHRERGELARGELVDYRRTLRAKRRVLEHCARALAASDGPERDAFEAVCERRPEIEDYARFRAACERTGARWHDWPERMRAGAIRDADCDPDVVLYHRYAQVSAGRQLELAAARAAEHGAGLYLDFPVGVHTDGYDAWRDRDVYAFGAHAGAPPDALFAGGQDWGFPPLHPERVRAAGYQPLVASLRAHCEKASLLRIDHVMGLHRMYWVPAGASAREGIYVRYHPDEMYAVLCIESARARTAIVGEDLGTVPREVRPMMASRGIQRMYVLQYELSPTAEPALGSVPRSALAALNTHDMPPFAAFLSGEDLRLQARLGWIDARTEVEEQRRRKRLVRALLAELRARGWLSARNRAPADVLDAALAFLAGSPARAVVASLDDLCGAIDPQNVPGTGGSGSGAVANWRRRLRLSVEELSASPDLARKLDALAEYRLHARRGVRPAGPRPERTPGKEPERTREKEPDRTREKETDRTSEKRPERTREIGTERTRETGTERTREIGTERTREIGTERTREIGTERTREREAARSPESEGPRGGEALRARRRETEAT